jgi:hypothetical protein
MIFIGIPRYIALTRGTSGWHFWLGLRVWSLS